MKQFKYIFIFTVFVLLSCNIFAFDKTQYQYSADITIDGKPDPFFRLQLTNEIYDKASLDLNDIRITDSDDFHVPYILYRPTDQKDTVSYQPTIINRSTNSDNIAFITLDFGRKVIKNRIEVHTLGDNFRRAVKIEGSSDNIEFFTIIEKAYLFAIPGTDQKYFRQIDFPSNDYRYLRIAVSPMPTEKESPEIELIKAFKVNQILCPRQSFEIEHTEHNLDEKTKSSIYIYDLAYKNLPVSELILNIPDKSFYRHITLQGRDQETRKIRITSEDEIARFREIDVSWKHVTSQAVYRYSTDIKNYQDVTISIPNRCYRYLKIIVANYDDAPIKIDSMTVQTIPHQLLCEPAANASMILYLGNEKASSPIYDLAKRVKQPQKLKATNAKIGTLVTNPAFGTKDKPPVPWTEEHKKLLIAILIIVVLVLCVFMIKSFKTIQLEQKQQN